MIYISKLELVNFQSHKNTVMEFDKGLNVIIGNSDSGKTSIIRAVKWALFNEPQGDAFIRQDETKCWVTVHFNTGAIVRRLRTASKNSYYLKKSNGEEYNFEAFGRNVPKEIIDEINMFKIEFDENNNYILNIAEQLEGPFLINEKPSLRASAIGRIVKVNLVDNAMRDTIRDRKNTQYQAKLLQNQIDDYKEQIKKYDYLEEKIRLSNKLKAIRDKIKNLEKVHKQYKNYKIALDKLNIEIKESEEILDKYKNLDKLINIAKTCENTTKTYYSLSRLRDNYTKNKIEIKDNLSKIKSLKNIEDIDKIYQDIYHSYFSKYKVLNDYNINYKKILNNIEENKSLYEKYKNTDNLVKLCQEIDNNLFKFNSFINLNTSYKDLNSRIKKGKSFLESYKNLEQVDKNYDELKDKIKSYLKYDKLISDLNIINQNSKVLLEDINKDNKKIDLLSKAYINTLLELGHCPYCMSEIDDNAISHLKHEL